MTFLVLSRIGGLHLIRETDDPADATDSLVWGHRMGFPDAFLAEVLIAGSDPRCAIPGELDRAIDAWNAMVPRLKFHADKVTKRDHFIQPFRAWKKRLGKRSYLLEQLIADVEATEFCHPWIRFGWLLRFKGGEANSDVLHSGQWKNGNGKGEMTEADFLRLAGRVTAWQRDSPDGASFLTGTGITYERWKELQARFNGAQQ